MRKGPRWLSTTTSSNNISNCSSCDPQVLFVTERVFSTFQGMEYPIHLLLQDSIDPEKNYYSLCGVYEEGAWEL